jgi:hypothetical protein
MQEVEAFSLYLVNPQAELFYERLGRGWFRGEALRGKFKFELSKHRLSGEVLTAHGNTLLTTLIVMYCFNTKHLVAEGDDSIFSVKDKKQIEIGELRAAQLGLVIKIKTRPSLDGLEF